MNPFQSPLVRKLVALAIEEDLATGDVTSMTCVPEEVRGVGRIIAREDLVVCGLQIVPVILDESGFVLTCEERCSEGSSVLAGTELLVLEGQLQSILAIERTVLNFMQRLSGVASFAHAAVTSVPTIVLLDTRKTMPGWRVLDKYAVRTGGARNHRFSLGDMVLIKNNHIDAVGGDFALLASRLERHKPWYMPVEVEVRSLDELTRALTLTPSVVMLDNFTDDAIDQAVKYLREMAPTVRIEVSGGITPKRLEDLRESGIDAVSMGALTTQARNVDISMSIVRDGAK